MSRTEPADPESWIEDFIRDFIENSPENALQNSTNEKAFEDFLVGFSRGDDPLYKAYKEFVGPYHWTPQEIFTLAFPDLNVGSDGFCLEHLSQD